MIPVCKILTVLIKTLVLCALLSTATIAQQTDNGSLSGSVTDQNGAVIPGATVTVTSVDTGLKRTATTGDDGRWTIAALKPGNYLVAAVAPSFAETKQQASVTASATLTVDLILGISVAEVVTVESGAASVVTE